MKKPKSKQKPVKEPVKFIDRKLIDVKPETNQFDSTPAFPVQSHKIMAGMG